jgi:L-malate glycosyltransferase
MSIKVLVISTWYPTNTSSSGTFVEMLSLGLKNGGVQVDTLLHNYYTISQYFSFSKPKYKKDKKLSFIHLNTILIPFSSDRIQKMTILWTIYLKLKLKYFFTKKPDLIHHHGCLDKCYITNFLSRKFQTPYIYTEHSPLKSFKSVSERNGYNNFPEIQKFAAKAHTRTSVSAYYKLVYQNIFNVDFDVVPNLVSQDFLALNNKVEIKPNSEIFTFIAIGNLIEVKNFQLLIRAFAKLNESIAQIKLLIIGTGNLEHTLSELSVTLKVDNKIQFLGHQSREGVVKNILQSNTLVVSSLKETFGVVLIESLMLGKPIIATKCGGVEDIVNDGVNGFLAENNSLESMVEMMKRMIKEYNFFNAEKLSEDAKQLFSEGKVVEKWKSIYNNVLKIKVNYN